MSDWMNNDKLFKSEIKNGHKWELFVADYFRKCGLDVAVNEQRVRPNVEKRAQYSDNGDIICNGHMIEIKSRRVKFTSPDDFPYPTLFVESCYRWRKKNPKPSALVCVSQETGKMIAIGPHEIARYNDWEIVNKYDRVKGGSYDYYVLPKSRWHKINRLIDWLKSNG